MLEVEGDFQERRSFYLLENLCTCGRCPLHMSLGRRKKFELFLIKWVNCQVQSVSILSLCRPHELLIGDA